MVQTERLDELAENVTQMWKIYGVILSLFNVARVTCDKLTKQEFISFNKVPLRFAFYFSTFLRVYYDVSLV